MKHEIEIPDLPEGWEAVAYRYVKNGDDVLLGKQIVSWLHKDLSTGSRYLIVRKKHLRRIVLEETGEIRLTGYKLKIDADYINMPAGREYKIAEDNKCAE